MKGTQGKYPMIVEDLSDNEAFMVTSWRWGENLGSILLTFDEHGLVVIGATTLTTQTISHVDELTTFLDLVEEVKKAIWEIRNTTDIKGIAALTHIGYDVDHV
ncbi:hypothetical protein Trihar35433_2008 [Trichoderma harzianum]|nr:hypothetical protein Trihar35433_2008 [Trichoderma harzianum]